MDFLKIYQSSIYYILHIVFFALVILVIFNLKAIYLKFKKVKRKTWIYLLLIFILGSFLRLFIFPHTHVIFVDEFWYMEAAKNMNHFHEPLICEYSDFDHKTCKLIPKPPGWSFLISFIFLFFGLNNHNVLFLSSFIGALSVILTFILSYLIFKNEKIALLSSFLLSISPLHLFWSISAETNIVSLFFVILTMILFFIFLEKESVNNFFLFIVSFIFTVLIRFETFFLIFLFVLGYIYLSKNYIKTKIKKFSDMIFPLIVLISLIIMIILENLLLTLFINYYVSIIDRYLLNLFDFLNSVFIGFILLPFTLLMLLFIKKDENKKKLYFLLLAVIFSLLLYLPIYFQSRSALVTHFFILILIAYSLDKLWILLKKINFLRFFFIALFLLLIFFSLSWVFLRLDGMDYSILETEAISKIPSEVPFNCYVITQHPTILNSVSDLKVLSTRNFLEERTNIGNRCVYFFKDLFCFDLKGGLVTQKQFCERLGKNYVLSNQNKFSRFWVNFGLFELKNQSLT